MSVTEDKATAIASQMVSSADDTETAVLISMLPPDQQSAAAKARASGGAGGILSGLLPILLPILLQLLQGFLGGGGLGGCIKPTPTPPKEVHDAISNPNRAQRRRLKRDIRQSDLPSALWELSYDSLTGVGSTTSEAEANALFVEANSP